MTQDNTGGAATIDTANTCHVTATGGGEGLRLSADWPAAPMTREQALNLAAWLVYKCDPDGQHFSPLFAAIRRDGG